MHRITKTAVICLLFFPCSHAAVENDLVITSDKVEFRRKEETTVFSGNVRAVYENHRLFADYMKSSRRAETVYLKGNVRTYYQISSTENYSTSSGFAEYYSNSKKTVLYGSPGIVYKSSSSEMRITSGRMSFDENNQVMDFTEDVLIKQGNNKARGARAKYTADNRELHLYSQEDSGPFPTLEYSAAPGDGAETRGKRSVTFTAREISMYLSENRIVFRERVHGKLETE